MSTDRLYNLNGGFKPTTKRSADLEGVDFYPTPAWATYALVANERFEGDIWECACGDGAMAPCCARQATASSARTSTTAASARSVMTS